MKIGSMLFLSLLGIRLAHATVAYTTNTGVQPVTPLMIADVTIDTGDEIAQLFTSQATGFLTSLTVGVNVSNNATTRSFLDFFLYADNAGTPGTLLEEIDNVDAGCSPPSPGVCNSVGFDVNGELSTADSVTNPMLVSGQNYWVGIQAVDRVNNPVRWWWGDTTNSPGTDFFSGGTWNVVTNQTDPQSLEVDVQGAVPEPANLFALPIAAAALLLLRRAQKS